MSQNIYNYTLHLADNSLIMGHRLSEWTGHAPALEPDIALTNIALDLIGQSRNLYQYAALLKGDGCTEDTLAYLRDANEFKNFLLVELPNSDWAVTIIKIFLFSTYQFFLYQILIGSTDEQLSAIAEKSLKEVTYHVRWSSEWVIRLGDGTEESHSRILQAVGDCWDYTAAFFKPGDEVIDIDKTTLKNNWGKKVKEVFIEATIPFPGMNWIYNNVIEDNHTAHLNTLLSEMQFLQRAYPGCDW